MAHVRGGDLGLGSSKTPFATFMFAERSSKEPVFFCGANRIIMICCRCSPVRSGRMATSIS